MSFAKVIRYFSFTVDRDVMLQAMIARPEVEIIDNSVHSVLHTHRLNTW